MKNIKPIDTLSLVDKVEIRLLEFFKNNNLKPGDPIPKELEFSESLGVSGMVLTEPDIINNFARILDPTLLGTGILKNLFELRLILEMGMADFLFERKTQKDLDDLEEIVVKEEEQESDQSHFSLDKEIAFHGKLYQISNNKTLQGFQQLLLPVFEYVHLKNTPQDFKHRYSSGHFVTHRMLMDNIKIGTPETFRNAMRHHLEPHFDSIFKEK
jgi:DNA-binding FadR family transcriptional regulator